MERLLIIDDNEEIRAQLSWGLAADYSTLTAEDVNQALAAFRENEPRVVTLDLGLAPNSEGTEEGFRCLREMLRHDPSAKVVVITGNDQRKNALKAIQMGAYDYYQKPIKLEELKIIIKRAFHLSGIERENRSLHSLIDGRAGRLSGMIGVCDEMHAVFSMVRKVGSFDATVLVNGESGTGKELIARAIHDLSPKKEGPFIAINCGAIPDSLLESELFGHEKGAFTGAHAQVQGKVEYANNGSLFLDEIGELPPLLQVKLLRFLQDKTFQRVGGREDLSVDTRIIAATNKDLLKEIGEGRFREDLYYRLGVVTIKVPPLRERREDIIVLATHFLKQYCEQYDKRVRGFSAAAVEAIEAYPWPGNVRELKNKIQRGIIVCEGPLVEPEDLGFDLRQARQNALTRETKTSLKAARERLEKDMIVSALEKYSNNVAKAAEELGVSRPTFYALMKKYGLLNTMAPQGQPEMESQMASQ